MTTSKQGSSIRISVKGTLFLFSYLATISLCNAQNPSDFLDNLYVRLHLCLNSADLCGLIFLVLVCFR